jgi:hypothetical protein
MNLWQDFLTNDDKLIHKWTHYFPIYEQHLSEWRNKTITFLEIGVSRGGVFADVEEVLWTTRNYCWNRYKS